MWWAFSRIGVIFCGVAAFWVVRALIEGSDPRFGFRVPISIIVSLLIIGFVVSFFVYLYIVPAGGIMSREERERENGDRSASA